MGTSVHNRFVSENHLLTTSLVGGCTLLVHLVVHLLLPTSNILVTGRPFSRLQEEKERMRLQREAEAQAREAWANEQRKFMEELMNQQRALKEQAEWISREHQQHGWSSAHDEHIAEGTRANDRRSDDSDRGHGGIDEADERNAGGMHREEGLDIRIRNELDTEAESTLSRDGSRSSAFGGTSSTPP